MTRVLNVPQTAKLGLALFRRKMKVELVLVDVREGELPSKARKF